MKDFRLGIYEKGLPPYLSWEDKFSAASDAGFDFFEISIDETDEKLGRLDSSNPEKEMLARLMLKHNMHIETMCLSGHRRFPIGSADGETRRRGIDIMEKAIIFARDIGIRIVQISGYDVYYEEPTEDTRRYFAENLEKSVELASRYGVILAFETMETEFLNTVSKAMHWVDKTNSPYLQIYPDTGNITNAAHLYGTDVLDDLKSGAGHIAAVHLKETVPGKYREIPYGTGHVPFGDIINTAYGMGVSRFLAEFWHVEGQGDWRLTAKNAADFLRGA